MKYYLFILNSIDVLFEKYIFIFALNNQVLFAYIFIFFLTHTRRRSLCGLERVSSIPIDRPSLTDKYTHTHTQPWRIYQFFGYLLMHFLKHSQCDEGQSQTYYARSLSVIYRGILMMHCMMIIKINNGFFCFAKKETQQ